MDLVIWNIKEAYLVNYNNGLYTETRATSDMFMQSLSAAIDGLLMFRECILLVRVQIIRNGELEAKHHCVIIPIVSCLKFVFAVRKCEA